MRVLLLALALVFSPRVPFAQSQSPSGPPPAFEVASIKPNRSGGLRQSSDRSPGGQVTETNVTLRDLIKGAYALRDQQVLGGPGWLDTDHFDVVAKAQANASGVDVDAMMRVLLAERFRLVVHFEKRELPVYELVLARSDRRLGPGLRARPDCADGEKRETDQAPCGGILFGPGRLAVRGMPVGAFAPGFARDRIVLDSTGLSGQFDVDLEWTPAAGDLPPGATPAPGDGASIFAALQEQLGLRLQPARAMVDVLVIDRAERPAAD